MSVFNFKYFSISDDNTPMKVGIDSVILGAWTNGKHAKYALDIGSGCGLLSLMLAQRFEGLLITGVEIYEPAHDDAVENLEKFYRRNHIRFFNNDINDWDSQRKFDLIISNPPYFSGSLKPMDLGRKIARFQETLSFEALAKAVQSLLADEGKFSLILAASDFETIHRIFEGNLLFLQRKTTIKHDSSSVSKRVLLEYGKYKLLDIQESQLIIKELNGSYSTEFKLLTKEFYIDF